MSEAASVAILYIIGVVVLAVSAVCAAIRKGWPVAVSWRGFGVTFAVTPCSECMYDPLTN